LSKARLIFTRGIFKVKIESIKTIKGANVYSHQPVILMRFDPENLSGKRTREISGFNERLLELFPNLKAHFCNRGHAGGFVERLAEGTHFNHVVEHIAAEILAQAGFAERDKKICNGDEKNDSLAVLETTVVETTRYVLPAAAEITEAIIKEKAFSIEEKITEAKIIAADTELGPSAAAIVEAAERRDIPWTRENEYSLVQLGYGKNLRYAQSAVTDATSVIGTDLVGDKNLTKQRLEKFSIPVPFGETVRAEAEAVKAFGEIGAPVVVKPLDGRQGKGVSLNLKTADDVITAFHTAREFSSKVLIEEQFEGKNYRVLVVGGKMVAASERLPCNVTGDGQHSISELIEIENKNPLRGEGHEKPLTKIKLTPILTASIENNGWKLTDIPGNGEQVMLCGGMNLSTGGTAKDVTDEVHQSVKTLCERAARIVNLDICGVDLVLEDISAPVPKTKGGIIEINTAPGLRMHRFPSEGKPRDVGGAIIEMLYPNGAPARIPIISVTGTNGKTTVTRMISHILTSSGINTGMTTTDGIYLCGEKIARGDTTGPISAKTILGDRAVEVAVLETARGGIVRRGLGFDWSDIGVITNISEDHIGQDGIESVGDLINIKALTAERVRPGGTLVINADDPNSLQVLEREKVREVPKTIVYFSLDEKNPRVRDHLSRNGLAYFVRNGRVIQAKGEERKLIISTNSIPATMNGLAEFQIANALAAIAASLALGLPVGHINCLQTFQNETNNPGRNNLYRVGAGYALIDYGHNPHAFAAICRMASLWRGKNVTGIIGVPGDRADRLVEEAGRVAAKGFHRIIIKEDKDLRGRGKGEIARLLCETVKREAPDRRCEIVLDEIEALKNVLFELNETEVVVIFYDKLDPVLKILEEYEAEPVAGFAESEIRAANVSKV
jgi:cyanophycin synthetase